MRETPRPHDNRSQDVIYTSEGATKGQGDENIDAVCLVSPPMGQSADLHVSGLDNAGKTTIVKKIMNEDVTTVSPTLGFIIKTIDFQG